MTEDEWDKRTPEWQGAQWPRCKSCGHIAQSHDNHSNEPQAGSCCDYTSGQCPTCGKWTSGHERIQCSCKGYVGPTFEELLVSL